MLEKVYLSNVCPLWTLERQGKVIAEKLNGDHVDYMDELTPAQRRSHKKVMPERDQLLRKTSRQEPIRISFASFAVAASTAEDFHVVLSRAADRKAELRDLHAGLTVKSHKDWTRALEIFAEAKRKVGEINHGRAGGEASAKVRTAKVREAAEKCRPFWGLKNPPSEVLAKKHGVSVGGLKSILGLRRVAQRNHQAALKRKRKAKSSGPMCSENGILGLSNAEISRIGRKAKKAKAA